PPHHRSDNQTPREQDSNIIEQHPQDSSAPQQPAPAPATTTPPHQHPQPPAGPPETTAVTTHNASRTIEQRHNKHTQPAALKHPRQPHHNDHSPGQATRPPRPQPRAGDTTPAPSQPTARMR